MSFVFLGMPPEDQQRLTNLVESHGGRVKRLSEATRVGFCSAGANLTLEESDVMIKIQDTFIYDSIARSRCAHPEDHLLSRLRYQIFVDIFQEHFYGIRLAEGNQPYTFIEKDIMLQYILTNDLCALVYSNLPFEMMLRDGVILDRDPAAMALKMRKMLANP